MAKKVTANEIEVGVIENAEFADVKDCKVMFTIGDSVAFDFDGYGYMLENTKKPYKRKDIIKIAYSGTPATEGFVFAED